MGEHVNAGITITLAVGIGIVVLLFILKVVFFSVRKNLESKIQKRFDAKDIIGASTRTNFLGLKSLGGWQIRGNGALVLTKDELIFLRAVPEKEFVIPVKSISEISMPKSFNGKSVLAPLLSVRFNFGDREDEIA